MDKQAEEAYKKRFLSKGQGVEDFSGPTPGSAYANMGREEYEKAITQRNQPTPSEVAPAAAESGVSDGIAGMGSQMATKSAEQGNMAGTLGGGMMMTGDPYLMAGGLGLSVLAAGEQNKRAQENAQREAYNARIAQRQQMMHQIASQGIA